MQKKIFWAVLIAALIVCTYFESTPEYNSQKIRAAELSAPDVPPVPEYPAVIITNNN